jgi:hypothetical protein
MKNEQGKTTNTLKYAGLATQWMVMLLIAVWGGMKLDKQFPMKVPLFVILLPVLALGISFWQLLNELKIKK